MGSFDWVTCDLTGVCEDMRGVCTSRCLFRSYVASICGFFRACIDACGFFQS